MIDVTEEAKKAYRKAIILFLRERIKTDELIAEGCKKENKTLDKCVEYIISQAKKQAENNVAFIPDEEVYGWVVHYLTEDMESDNAPKYEPAGKESEPEDEAQKENEAKTQLSESLKKVAMKYSFVEKNLCGFFVVVAKSKEDLIYEGELLKHCVGKMGYDKKQANEESLICFIRRDKKTPFVTCELDLKTMKIRQCYGINNTQITDPDFIQFKEEWLKVIHKEYKKAVAA
jgi:hypothetical protein